VNIVVRRKGWGYLSRYPFFGLTPEHKLYLHEQIFSLSYYSEGAFTQDIVYNLPIYLRNYYLNLLIKTKEKEQQQLEKSSGGSSKLKSKR
jgi:hypothetical protein